MKDKRLGKIIIKENEIKQRIGELAEKINSDYQDRQLIIISIMKSSLYFMADLTRKLELPIILDFLELSHYSHENDSGEIRVTRDLEYSIANKDVLILESIINTGLTHNYLRKNLESRNPKSLSICTFLNNKEKKLVEIPVEYSGFEISNGFVVGYGLDYKGKYRNLPYIAEYERGK